MIESVPYGAPRRSESTTSPASRTAMWARADAATIRERLPAELPEAPMDPVAVIEDLAAAVDPGLIAASAGPRFFGFVFGGGCRPRRPPTG